MAIIRWNPIRESMNMEREFNRMFNSLNKRFKPVDKEDSDDEFENAVWMPLADISENKDSFLINVDLPGIDKKDVKISYTEGQLTISGERKQEKETNNSTYHRVERSYGKYYRSFNLPKEIKADNIDAEFKNGQLMITIPKSEEVKPKEIEVKVK